MIEFFFNPLFWIICLMTFFIRHISFPFPFSSSGVFGTINLLWIYLLLGDTATVALVVISGTIWCGAKSITFLRKRDTPEKQISIFTWVLLLTLAGLFLSYKLVDPAIPSKGWGILLTGLPDPVFKVFRLLAFSFVFLRLVDFIRSVSWGGMKVINPLGLAGYILPFNMVGAGPICSYAQYLTMDDEPIEPPSFDHLTKSIGTIVNGLFYKVVLAQGLKIMVYGVNGQIETETWNDAAFLLVYIFFDFAGYSLLALGIGQLCRIPTPRNFHLPFMAPTVTEFWVRWHMSLGDFVRRNIFTPLQLHFVRFSGVTRSAFVSIPVLIISFSFVGLWHKVSIEFLLWGLFVGCLMAVEKFFFLKRPFWITSENRAIVFGRKVIGPVYVFITMTTGLFLIQAQMLPS